jgi:hypothetical protein
VPKFKNEVVADAGKVGQSAPRDIPTTGDAIASELDIEPVQMLPKQKKLDDLKFMEDTLTIRVDGSNDKFAKPIIDVANGGRTQFLVRGVPIHVKRKFVEVLARSKPIGYTGETYIDRSTGEAVNRMNPSIGLQYPFTVQQDPAGEKGRLWLEQVLSEA